MTHAIKVLLQTTIPSTADDWSIARFGRLAEFLRAQRWGADLRLKTAMRSADSVGGEGV